MPALQQLFATDIVLVSFNVSVVILGISLPILPFGFLGDRVDIHPILLTGGIFVALSGFVCAVTQTLWLLLAARFVQGLFIPALTTCLAAYLAKTLPVERVNVVMGSYVSAGAGSPIAPGARRSSRCPANDWNYFNRINIHTYRESML